MRCDCYKIDLRGQCGSKDAFAVKTRERKFPIICKITYKLAFGNLQLRDWIFGETNIVNPIHSLPTSLALRVETDSHQSDDICSN